MAVADKIGSATRLVDKFTGTIQRLTEFLTPYLTLKNILFVLVIWFLLWYWTKSNEEKFDNYRKRLPYR